MPGLAGVRVVRGPDWKWGEQDGGEGNVGTVIDTPEIALKQFGDRTVCVIWDSGIKAHYRAGPEGAHDLRIVDNSAAGVKHAKMSCGGCAAKEIVGTRWHCSDCLINLCSNCIYKEVPHNKSHTQFKRFDTINLAIDVSISTPEGRIKLLGFYPGAKVVQGPELTHDPRDYSKEGSVIPNSKSEKMGEILVEWSSKKEGRRAHQLGHWDLQVSEPGVGGFYQPDTLSVLDKLVDNSMSEALGVDGVTALHSACREGKVEAVRALLEDAKTDIEQPDGRGFRPIHHAVLSCEPKILEILISKGAQLDSQTASGKTALHIAVANQFTECVRLLIQRGCNVNIQDLEGDSALHDAIHGRRSLDIIRILISSGRTDLKLCNHAGFNVLHLSALKNNLKAFQIILEEGDRDLVLERIGTNLYTVLHYACYNRNFQMVKSILDRQEAVPNLLLYKLLEAKAKSGKTAFLISVLQRDYPTIEMLIDYGANIYAVDGQSNSALMVIAENLEWDDIPSKELCPAIHQDEAFRKLMKKDSRLGFLGYLLDRGCDWKESNFLGHNASSFLRRKGFPKSETSILDRFAAKCKKKAPIPRKVAPYTDPSKKKKSTSYYSSSDDEDYSDFEDTESYKLDKTVVYKKLEELEKEDQKDLPQLSDYVFNWYEGDDREGIVLDQFGNKYIFSSGSSSMKKTEYEYRCIKEATLVKKRRCKGMLKRIVDLADGTASMELKQPHQHRMIRKRGEGQPVVAKSSSVKRKLNGGSGTRNVRARAE